jgi:hypothetical protein
VAAAEQLLRQLRREDFGARPPGEDGVGDQDPHAKIVLGKTVQRKPGLEPAGGAVFRPPAR